jgi:FkbM family methyltransferase
MDNGTIGLALTATREGKLYFFESDGPIGSALAAYGEWARREIELSYAYIGAGSTVLDIGANIGTHTVAYAQRVGPTGSVIAFEPQVAVFDVLERNVRLNNLENVQLHCSGVGRTSGTMKVPDVNYSERLNIGAIALLPADSAQPGSDVGVVAIDDCPLSKWGFAKIDAEGMSDAVLTGMARSIREFRPVLLVECNSVAEGAQIQQALDWDRYKFYLASFSAFNPDNFAKNSDNLFGFANETSLLCVPEESDRLTPTIAGVTLTPVQNLDELASALMVAPRYGDATPFDRNPAQLKAAFEQQTRDAEAVIAVQQQQLRDAEAFIVAGRQRQQEIEATLAAEQARCAQLSDAQQRAEFRAASLFRQISQIEDRLTDEQARAAKTKSELASAASALAEHRERLASRHGELQDIRAHKDQLEQRIQGLEKTVADIRASTSWKASYPIRWLKRRVRL